MYYSNELCVYINSLCKFSNTIFILINRIVKKIYQIVGNQIFFNKFNCNESYRERNFSTIYLLANAILLVELKWVHFKF